MRSQPGKAPDELREIIRKEQPLKEERLQLQLELDALMEPAKKLRPETNYKVMEIGADFIGFSRRDRKEYIPLSRIARIYAPVETPPAAETAE
jgi:hypothetical protein